MISATSSLASNLLSGTFGTPAIATPTNSATTSPSSNTNINASIVATLAASSGPDAAFLANASFAQATESLLLDPHSNGAISGTPSAYVQHILQQLAPGSSAANNSSTQTSASASPAATATDATTPSLPPDGVLA